MGVVWVGGGGGGNRVGLEKVKFSQVTIELGVEIVIELGLA